MKQRLVMCSAFLHRPRAVLVDEPGWAVEFARLAALGMHILPVPRRADGPDLEAVAERWRKFARQEGTAESSTRAFGPRNAVESTKVLNSHFKNQGFRFVPNVKLPLVP